MENFKRRKEEFANFVLFCQSEDSKINKSKFGPFQCIFCSFCESTNSVFFQ